MNGSNNIARIDLAPVGGIAGDMFAAAVFDAYPSLYDDFLRDLAELNVAGVTARLQERLCNGLQARYFDVQQQTDLSPPRTLSGIKEFISAKNIHADVARHTVGLFTLLAGAEAEVHGSTVDAIHFHEVSDWDSMVDLLAAAGIIARLDCQHWRVGALPLGSGTVNTAHGDIPIPAPATLALLKNFRWQDDGIGGERVTPTGAAILAYLNAQPSEGGSLPEVGVLTAIGCGCGTREFTSRANILRATVFSSVANADAHHDEVIRIAFEVDDMTAEEISWAGELIRESTGVADVSCVNMFAKKGRISTGFRIIVQPPYAQTVMDCCFAVTTTIGLRYETVSRRLLPREDVRVDNASSDGLEGMNKALHVKRVIRSGSEAHTVKVESDDLHQCHTLQQRRKLASGIEHVALQQPLEDSE